MRIQKQVGNKKLWLREDVHRAVSQSLVQMLHFLRVNNIEALLRKLEESEIEVDLQPRDLIQPRREQRIHSASLRQNDLYPVLRGISYLKQNKDRVRKLPKRKLALWRARIEKRFQKYGGNLEASSKRIQFSRKQTRILHEVYTFYCSQTGPLHFTGIEVDQFMQLLEDARVLDDTVRSQVVQTCFIKCCFDMCDDTLAQLTLLDTFCLPRLLTFDWFLTALSHVSTIKSPRINEEAAFLSMLHENILPYAKRRRLDALSKTLGQPSVLPQILGEEYVLEKLFSVYSGSQISDGAMDLQELSQFCNDFKISPRVPSNVIEFNFNELLCTVAVEGSSDEDEDDELRFPEFVEIVGRLAVILFPPSESVVLRGLIGRYRTDFIPPVSGVDSRRTAPATCPLPVLLCDPVMRLRLGTSHRGGLWRAGSSRAGAGGAGAGEDGEGRTGAGQSGSGEGGDARPGPDSGAAGGGAQEEPPTPEKAEGSDEDSTQSDSASETGDDRSLSVPKQRKQELEGIALQSAQRIMQIPHPWSVPREAEAPGRPRTKERALRLPRCNQKLRRAPRPGWRPRKRSTVQRAKEFDRARLKSLWANPGGTSGPGAARGGNQAREGALGGLSGTPACLAIALPAIAQADQRASQRSCSGSSSSGPAHRSGPLPSPVNPTGTNEHGGGDTAGAASATNGRDSEPTRFEETAEVQVSGGSSRESRRGREEPACGRGNVGAPVKSNLDGAVQHENEPKVCKVSQPSNLRKEKQRVTDGVVFDTLCDPKTLWNPPKTPEGFNLGIPDSLAPNIANRLACENQERLWFADLPPPKLPKPDFYSYGKHIKRKTTDTPMVFTVTKGDIIVSSQQFPIRMESHE